MTAVCSARAQAVLSLDCLLGDDPAIRPFYVQTLGLALLPALVVLVPLPLLGSAGGRATYVAVVVILLFMIYPNLVQQVEARPADRAAPHADGGGDGGGGGGVLRAGTRCVGDCVDIVQADRDAAG